MEALAQWAPAALQPAVTFVQQALASGLDAMQPVLAPVQPGYDFLGTDAGGLLLWGLFSRGLGLIFAVSLGALAWQMVPLAGRYGLTPVRDMMAAWKRDFGARAYLYHPTLFWINNSDMALRLLPALGAVAGLVCAVGGPWAPVCLLVAWASLVSIDSGPHGLVYPWDSLLFEMGFAGLFLPATKAPACVAAALQRLPGFEALVSEPASSWAEALAAESLPSALQSWAYRYLLFRLLFGFGKLKFSGSGWRDRLYVKAFTIIQPMLSPFGWWCYHHLPDFMFPLLLGGMWAVEMPLPWTVFMTSGLLRFVSAAGIIALMGGIILTGNFGYFNIATIVLALPSLHHSATLSLSVADLLPPTAAAAVAEGDLVGAAATHWRAALYGGLYLSYLLPASVLQLVMNSWINNAWHHYAKIYSLRLPLVLRWTQAYAFLLRILQPLRLVQAYGVFPPQTSPSQRWAMVFEGSADGVTWKRYHYSFYLSAPTTAPSVIAPYHPRFDHATFYESLAIAGFCATLGHHSPYNAFASGTAYHRLALKLLQGGRAAQTVGFFFRTNPFPDPAAPPKMVRMLACHYLPASPAHTAATGEYWHETPVCLHIAPMSLDSLAHQQPHAAVVGASPSTLSAFLRPGLPDAGATAAVSGAEVVRRAVTSPPGEAPAEAWPFGDLVPTPENFWWDSVIWRRRARLSAGTITRAAYEEAWRFIADARNAALLAAARAAIAIAGARGAVKAAPASIPSPTACIDTAEAAYVRLPLSAQKLEASVRTLASRDPRDAAVHLTSAGPLLGADEPLPLDAANQVLVWSLAQPALASLRRRYTSADLVRIRGTLARMSLPLMRACERLFYREAPSEEAWARELASEAADAALGPFSGEDAALPAMIDGSPVDSAAPARHGSDLPDKTPAGAPVHYYDGNDDAGAAGSMRNPTRWGMFCQWLMLVGGRAAFETAIFARNAGEGASLEALLLDRRLPTGFHGAGAADPIARAPLGTLYRHLVCGGGSAASRLSPARMGTEAGTFLLLLLGYETFSSHAVTYHRLSSQSRPAMARAPVNPTFLPGFLDFIPRMNAHPELRQALYPAAARACAAGDRAAVEAAVALPPSAVPAHLRSKDTTRVVAPVGTDAAALGDRPCVRALVVGEAEGFLVEPTVPRWHMTADASWWTFEGFNRFVHAS